MALRRNPKNLHPLADTLWGSDISVDQVAAELADKNDHDQLDDDTEVESQMESQSDTDDEDDSDDTLEPSDEEPEAAAELDEAPKEGAADQVRPDNPPPKKVDTIPDDRA